MVLEYRSNRIFHVRAIAVAFKNGGYPNKRRAAFPREAARLAENSMDCLGA
jgi:hypothetical protein